jgi:PPOX class probable F420-dependent enzyme
MVTEGLLLGLGVPVWDLLSASKEVGRHTGAMTTTIPDSHRDLLDGQIATLATIGGDGRPQLSEVWFLAEDDTFRTSLNTARQKVKNLRRNPACALLILDLANPYRYLEIRGDAEIEPDPDYAFADKLGAKYQADLRERDNPGETRVIVTVRPLRVRAWG